MAFEMDANTIGFIGLAVGVLGIAIGVIASILVSRHYYLRQQDKKLSPFIHLSSAVLSGIDPAVRKDLKISYRGTEINDLFQLQIVIANDGEKGISCIEPLSIAFPLGVKVLDAAILHKHPNELKVDALPPRGEPGGGVRIAFPFPVLNTGEYFVVKFLLEGRIKVDDLSFDIAAEDLPHKLPLQPLPAEVLMESAGGPDRTPLWIGLGLLSFAGIIGYGTYLMYVARPDMFPIPWNTFKFNFFRLLVVLFWVLTPLSFVILAVTAIVAGLVPSRRSKSRFTLPTHMRHYDRHAHIVALGVGDFAEHEETPRAPSSKDSAQGLKRNQK